MKPIHTILAGTCLIATMAACNQAKEQDVPATRTPEALAMLQTLKTLPEQGVFMFGHHDDPVYGIRWDGDENRSDVEKRMRRLPCHDVFRFGTHRTGR